MDPKDLQPLVAITAPLFELEALVRSVQSAEGAARETQQRVAELRAQRAKLDEEVQRLSDQKEALEREVEQYDAAMAAFKVSLSNLNP